VAAARGGRSGRILWTAVGVPRLRAFRSLRQLLPDRALRTTRRSIGTLRALFEQPGRTTISVELKSNCPGCYGFGFMSAVEIRRCGSISFRLRGRAVKRIVALLFPPVTIAGRTRR